MPSAGRGTNRSGRRDPDEHVASGFAVRADSSWKETGDWKKTGDESRTSREVEVEQTDAISRGIRRIESRHIDHLSRCSGRRYSLVLARWRNVEPPDRRRKPIVGRW
jgi:hypothetical protein